MRGRTLAWVVGGICVCLGTCGGLGALAVSAMRTRAARVAAVTARALDEQKRPERLASVVGAVAPAPLPTGFPLVGNEGVLADGYPRQTVDRAAMRSLLWHKKYADLSRYIGMAQDAFEKDTKKEYWILDACDSFFSAEPALTEALNAWVASEPQSWAAYLARATHYMSVAFQSRGAGYTKDTSTNSFAQMDAALVQSGKDLDKVESLRPKLMAAYRAKLRVSGFSSKAPPVSFDEAANNCPTCFQIRQTQLIRMKPRWGGSYPAMQAFADKERRAHEKDNPRFSRLAFSVVEDEVSLLRNDASHALAKLAPILTPTLNGPVRSLHGDLLARSNDYAGAQRDFDMFLTEHPQDPGVLIERGYVLAKQGQHLEGAKNLLLALRIAPTETRGREIRDWMVPELHNETLRLHEAGQREAAIAHSEMLLELTPNLPSATQLHFHAVLGKDETRSGIEAELRARMAKDPDSFYAVQHVDYFLSRSRRFDLILPLWNDYLTRHPDDARAYLERSGTHHQLGHRDDARSDAQKACALGLNEGCSHAH
jgi:tetratricopeptide (TPR) repeat protein